MNDSDLLGLPDATQKLALRLFDLGLDRPRIHGFYVLLGFYAGAPDTKQRLVERFDTLCKFLPLDRSRDIDEVIGHVYGGYDRQINEFCFRTGIKIDFRKIQIPGSAKTISVVYPQNEGLLNPEISRVDRLVDSSRLYYSFLDSLGQSTLAYSANLLEAFACGVFQIQLLAQSDANGARQIAVLMEAMLPIFIGRCFRLALIGDVEYFLGLTGEQIALLDLMQPMELSYAQQMWGFQSSLFYRDQELLGGVDGLVVYDWHAWVLKNARNFDTSYPANLVPFSRSNVVLLNVPLWQSEVGVFGLCDRYIEKVWGYSASTLNNEIDTLEYKALLVHLVYSSLTSAREQVY